MHESVPTAGIRPSKALVLSPMPLFAGTKVISLSCSGEAPTGA